jgi:hypothetical protein
MTAFNKFGRTVREFEKASEGRIANASPERQDRPYPLLESICNIFKWAILAPAIPRLALLGLTFCQTLLLAQILTFMKGGESRYVGYALIGSYGAVYAGIAVG